MYATSSESRDSNNALDQENSATEKMNIYNRRNWARHFLSIEERPTEQIEEELSNLCNLLKEKLRKFENRKKLAFDRECRKLETVWAGRGLPVDKETIRLAANKDSFDLKDLMKALPSTTTFKEKNIIFYKRPFHSFSRRYRDVELPASEPTLFDSSDMGKSSDSELRLASLKFAQMWMRNGRESAAKKKWGEVSSSLSPDGTEVNANKSDPFVSSSETLPQIQLEKTLSWGVNMGTRNSLRCELSGSVDESESKSGLSSDEAPRTSIQNILNSEKEAEDEDEDVKMQS